MTWLSINPRSEPYTRKDAANAIYYDPNVSEAEYWANLRSTSSLTPVELAQRYNNAENLGLDLNSIKVHSKENQP